MSVEKGKERKRGHRDRKLIRQLMKDKGIKYTTALREIEKAKKEQTDGEPG